MSGDPHRVDVAIVGAGQAGLSLSHCLTRAGVEHVVLERARVAESWRTQRWDAFCLVTPNWSIRLAGHAYDGADPHGFMGRDEVVSLLEDYAASFSAPVVSADVATLTPRDGGFELRARDGQVFRSRVAVVATATHRHARVPSWADRLGDDLHRIHASEYRSPSALPAGAVLVVGSAQSGCQIADELNRAGRRVYLATGATGRLPRRYRGRDIIEWQRDMGFLDRRGSALETPAHRFRPDPHLSGQGGGRTLDLRSLACEGVTLLGRASGAQGATVAFESDLSANLDAADAFAARVLADIDRHVDAQGITAPVADPSNSEPGYTGTPFVPTAPQSLDLDAAGVGTVIWATGFRHDFRWVQAPVMDGFGYPVQRDGVTAIPGLHFLGLNYVDRRASGILYGVGEDAGQLAGVVRSELASR